MRLRADEIVEELMDAEQLQQLAINAEINHWPPHLGVTTDAEKIDYLAQRLRESVRVGESIDDLNDRIGALEEENADLQSRLDGANAIIDKVKDAIK